MHTFCQLGAAAALATTLSCGPSQANLLNLPLQQATAEQRSGLTNGAEYSFTPAGLMGGEWLCLDIRGASADTGAVLQLWECNDSEAQRFKRVGQALQGVGGTCLEVVPGDVFSGAKVRMSDCEEGASHQAWETQGHALQLKGTDLCLDVSNGLANQGAGLQVWQCQGENAHQMWSFSKRSSGNSRSETDDATVKNLSGRKLIWHDEFEEDALDESLWARETPEGDDDHTGGKNKEQQRYTKDAANSYVEDGKLHIVVRKDGSGDAGYTSARLSAKNDGGFGLGRIETRLKVPCGQGLRSLAWLRPAGAAAAPWPTSGELDFVEILGGNANTLHATAHFGEEAPNNTDAGDAYTLSSKTFCEAFHVFAIERSANKVTWLLDDQAYFTLTPEDAAFTDAAPWPFDNAFDVVFGITVGGKWPGKPDASIDTAELVVDYLRVYGPQDEGDGAAAPDAAHAETDQGKEVARPRN